MRCSLHCPPASSALRGPLRALGVLAVLAACGWAVTALAPFWADVLLLEAVLAVAGVWALQRLVRYWGWRKPRPARAAARVTARAELVRAPYQITAPPLAISPPTPVGIRSASSNQRACLVGEAPVAAAVVPAARAGAKVKA